MKQKAHGQVRRSQVITTYGPGALIDLPHESAIVAGLDEWPPPHKLDEVDEPRLARKLRTITGVAAPRVVPPAAVSSDSSSTPHGRSWRPERAAPPESSPSKRRPEPSRDLALVHGPQAMSGLVDGRRTEPPIVLESFGGPDITTRAVIPRVAATVHVEVLASRVGALRTSRGTGREPAEQVTLTRIRGGPAS